MLQNRILDLIVVPQGAEQRAVWRGIRSVSIAEQSMHCPAVVSIPVGPQAAYHYLKSLQVMGQLPPLMGCNVLLMGLGGGLSPQYQVGDVVLLSKISFVDNQGAVLSSASADLPFVQRIYTVLKQGGSDRCKRWCIGVEKGITCDRVISEPSDKRMLHQVHRASVVDMEGEPIIRFFHSLGANVAVLRVISDSQNIPIPDLNKAIDSSGHLQPGLMAWECLKRPFAAMHLVRGGLRALAQLSRITRYFLAH